MTYRVRTENHATLGGWDGTVFVLQDADDTNRAAVWPAFGFNCYSWRVTRAGRALDLLYADPQLFDDSKPTRSGIPILFPFPNRIRAGRFTWEGQEYQLARNDSSGQNAIHGFPCRRPWRVVDSGADGHSAWVTGEFQASVDAPEVVPLWPADYRLRVTHRLLADRLRVEAEVHNPDRVPLPFGLGYHPYFHTPFAGGDAAGCLVSVPATSYWELRDSLPTGQRLSVDAGRDLRTPRRLGDLTLDDVLTDVASDESAVLCLRGTVEDPAAQATLRVFTSPAFRELVAFTPPHRQAVCLEPYTCTTDAINLQQRGVDAGLLVLEPGLTWRGVVEFSVSG
jgi:aldose 1-epimerase